MLFRETKIIFIKSLGTISGVYWVSQTSNRFLLITRNTDFLLEIQGISDIENIKIPNVKITTSWCHNITASQLTPNSVTYVTKQFLSQFMGLDVDCHSADLSFSAMLYTGNNLFQLNWAQINPTFLIVGPLWRARQCIFSRAWQSLALWAMQDCLKRTLTSPWPASPN